jgi:hypothetical protein
VTYSHNYKQQKPLSSRINVEQPLNEPTGVKQRKKMNAPEPPPNYMKPVRTSGKSQGIEEGSSGDVKDYLASCGDASPMTGAELHLAQIYAAGNDEALDAL